MDLISKYVPIVLRTDPSDSRPDNNLTNVQFDSDVLTLVAI